MVNGDASLLGAPKRQQHTSSSNLKRLCWEHQLMIFTYKLCMIQKEEQKFMIHYCGMIV